MNLTYKQFCWLETLVKFINKNNIPKESIQGIYKLDHDRVLVYWEEKT